jgi:hypothetical protein
MFALLFAAAGCRMHRGIKGSGVRKIETRDLKPFNAIETTGAYEIVVACQKSASFEIEGDDNILPLIRTEVRDGVLFVTPEQGYNSNRPISLRINLPDLVSVVTQGAGKIHVADVKNDRIEFRSTGAAAIDAAGETKTVEISSTGAGKIDTSALRAGKAIVKVTGAAKVNVYASDQLDVTVSGAGHVTYSGDPKVVNKSVSGIGSVSKND